MTKIPYPEPSPVLLELLALMDRVNAELVEEAVRLAQCHGVGMMHTTLEDGRIVVRNIDREEWRQ